MYDIRTVTRTYFWSCNIPFIIDLSATYFTCATVAAKQTIGSEKKLKRITDSARNDVLFEAHLVKFLLHGCALASELLHQLQLALNDLHLVRLLRQTRLKVGHLLWELVHLQHVTSHQLCTAFSSPPKYYRSLHTSAYLPHLPYHVKRIYTFDIHGKLIPFTHHTKSSELL